MLPTPRSIPGPLLLVLLGLIVPLPARAQPVEILHAFEAPPALTAAGLVEGPDGALYGTSVGGGAYGSGTVYRVTPAGAVTTLHSFTGAGDGAAPQGGLVSDGAYFYGTTSLSQQAPHGTVFRISATGPLETLFTFGGTDGSRPYSTLTLGTDGWLYGTTLFGGASGLGSNGTLYRLRVDGTGQEVLHDFGASGEPRTPWAGVTEGESGVFYGATLSGGASGRGTLYRWSEAGGFAILHSFPATAGAGWGPRGDLLRDSAGSLWGTTAAGGASGCGTVFRREAASGVVSTVHSFACDASGSQPAAGLVLGPDGRLWGTTAGNFTSGATVFRLDAATGAHSVVHAFAGGQVYARGRLLAASDGRLYGTNEGVHDRPDRGSVFRIDPGGGDAFETLRAFGLTADGWEPQGLAVADDGTLYGTTHYGGGAGLGTAFRIGNDGSFETIYAFADADPGGGIPSSTRVTWASDGRVYGTRSEGGGTPSPAGGGGTLFAMTPSGDLFDLFEFPSGVPRLNGTAPFAALVEGSDGDLYGTTVYGGTFQWGTVFRISKAGSLTTLASLTGVVTGSEPLGRLVEGSDGLLYGTAFLNGWNGYSAGWGSLFRIAKSGGPLQNIYQFFDTVGGYSPAGGLTAVEAGRFFGAARGGQFGLGVLFELTVGPEPHPALPTVSYRVLHEFGPGDGSGVSRELVAGADGFVYGTTIVGGPSQHGAVFRIRSDGSGYEIVHFFAGLDGSRADGLAPGPDGNLYGITQAGGPSGGGVVFRVRLAPVCDAGGPYTVDEGASVDVSATCDRAATFEWDLDGDGEFETIGQTVSFSAAGRDGPALLTIRVRGTDGAGLSAMDTAEVQVANVAPTVAAGSDAALLVGETLERIGTFDDPGPDSWTAAVDYDDGSAAQPLPLSGMAFTLDHTYTGAGTFTVAVTVTDDDGGVGTDTVEVTVTSVEDSIGGLIEEVQRLVDDGRLNRGQGNSLIVKLEAALRQLGRGNVHVAVNNLEAFVNEVTADIQSGKLAPEEGQPLIEIATRIIAALG